MNNKQIISDKIFGLDRGIFLLWLQPFGMLVLFIVSFGLVILPKFDDISQKISQIKLTNQKTTEVNQKRTYIQTVDQEELQNNASILSAGLLPEKSAYLLVKVVQNVAAGVGYAIDDFSVSLGDIKNADTKARTATSYDKIPVEVTLVGDSQKYLDLVKAIEKSLPIMSIDNFEMRSSADGATIKLNISAYYMKDISNVKLENLSLADLTPSKEEMDLLMTIKGYSLINTNVGGSEGTFTKYNRSDPFFTL